MKWNLQRGFWECWAVQNWEKTGCWHWSPSVFWPGCSSNWNQGKGQGTQGGSSLDITQPLWTNIGSQVPLVCCYGTESNSHLSCCRLGFLLLQLKPFRHNKHHDTNSSGMALKLSTSLSSGPRLRRTPDQRKSTERPRPAFTKPESPVFPPFFSCIHNVSHYTITYSINLNIYIHCMPESHYTPNSKTGIFYCKSNQWINTMKRNKSTDLWKLTDVP